MEHSYDNDFVKTFPQHQQPLGARHDHDATRLESGDNATKYAILVTIACIVVVQFRDTITSWIRYCRERGSIHVVWDLWEAVLVHLQALLETAKIFISSLYSMELDTPSLAIRQRRALAAMSSMPELEDMEYVDHAQEKNESTTKDTNGAEHGKANWRRLENGDELEPAFLREEDYPPDWMVYDGTLGVILKTEADNKRRSKQPLLS